MSDSHQSTTTTKQHFKPFSDLLHKPLHSDFTILVGTSPHQHQFHVHRLILSHNSTYFSRACYSPAFTESTTGKLHLPDCDIEVMKRLIEWLYTGKCNILKEMKALDEFKDDAIVHLEKVKELAEVVVELEEYADYFGCVGLKGEIGRLVPWWVDV